MEKEAWHPSQFIVTWLTGKTLAWQSLVTTAKTEHSCKDVNLKDATNVIFTTLGQVSSSWETWLPYLPTVSSLSSTNVMIQCSYITVTCLAGDGDQMTYRGGSNPTYPYQCACGVCSICASAQTSHMDVTAIGMIMCGARTAVCLQSNPTFPSNSWGLEIPLHLTSSVITPWGNWGAMEYPPNKHMLDLSVYQVFLW